MTSASEHRNPVDMTAYLEAWSAGTIQPPPVARLIGFELAEWEHGVARVGLEAGEAHHNPMGIVHGGILGDLADAAMGVAAASTLNPGEKFLSQDLHIRFHHPAVEGLLNAEAQVV